ncbi:helix-hairpin-helix domain-containing protein [Streptomyces hypolithicus]
MSHIRPDAADGGGGGLRHVRLALRERLPVWVQARCGLEPKTLAALAVALVVAAVFAAQHFWTGRPQSVEPPDVVAEEPVAVRPEPSPGAPATAPGAAAARLGAGAAPAPGDARIVVDVSGKVRRPGIHRLPAGSRVADALHAAGGVKTGADTAGLNRARLLMDGEQVAVGLPGAAGAAGPAAPGGSGAASGAGASSGAAFGPTTAPVGLSAATAEQLEALPGVGPVLAQAVIDYRTEHGGFRSVDELREVRGIGDRRFADLQPLVRP